MKAMTIMRVFNIAIAIYQIEAFIRPSGSLDKARIFYADNDQWDSGEVSWEDVPFTQYSATGFTKSVPLLKENDLNENAREPTPLYIKMQDDQDRLASVSAVVKESYKEFFNFDVIFTEFNSNLNSHRMFTPSEMVILTFFSGFAFLYNKVKETEINRLTQLNNVASSKLYFKKYKEIRKFTMMLFILATCLFTRNVQIAE
jgi:hypothetical protein